MSNNNKPTTVLKRSKLILRLNQGTYTKLQTQFVVLSAEVISNKMVLFYAYDFKNMLGTHYSRLVEKNLNLKLNKLDLFLENPPFLYEQKLNTICFKTYEQNLFEVFFAFDEIVMFLQKKVAPDIKKLDLRIEFLTLRDRYRKIQVEGRQLFALSKAISLEKISNQ